MRNSHIPSEVFFDGQLFLFREEPFARPAMCEAETESGAVNTETGAVNTETGAAVAAVATELLSQ